MGETFGGRDFDEVSKDFTMYSLSVDEVESLEGLLQCVWLQTIEIQPVVAYLHQGLLLFKHVGSCWIGLGVPGYQETVLASVLFS